MQVTKLRCAVLLAVTALSLPLLSPSAATAQTTMNARCDAYTNAVVSTLPKAARPGQQFRVQVSGFPPRSEVRFQVQLPGGDLAVWATGFTDDLGAIDLLITVPDGTALGDYTLIAFSPECPSMSPTTRFRVGDDADVAGSTTILAPTTSSPAPTTTAKGDDSGVMGITIKRPSKDLAFTGAASLLIAGAGILFLVAGMSLVGARRRRRDDEQ